MLVEVNQEVVNEHAVSFPWGMIIHQPLCKLRNNMSYFAALLTKLEYPKLQADRVDDPQPSARQEAPCELYHCVFWKVDRYQLWR